MSFPRFASQILLVALCISVACVGCRRRARPDANAGGESSGASGTEAAATAAAPVASAPADPAAFAAPLPPPNAELTVEVERRFLPAEPMNAYAPAAPGDYQAQLNLYNRVLRQWTVNAGNVPNTMQELMATYNSPKPPQPPAGRTLVYDRKTISVRLQ